MGAVYKARQKELDRIVALKILPPGIGEDAAFAGRFAREAKALAKLNHPGIVTLYEFGQVGGRRGDEAETSNLAATPPPNVGGYGIYYFLMEFVDGVNLRQLLHAGRIAPREALAIVRKSATRSSSPTTRASSIATSSRRTSCSTAAAG